MNVCLVSWYNLGVNLKNKNLVPLLLTIALLSELLTWPIGNRVSIPGSCGSSTGYLPLLVFFLGLSIFLPIVSLVISIKLGSKKNIIASSIVMVVCLILAPLIYLGFTFCAQF